MRPLSTKAQAIKASTTLGIDALYKQMRAEGIDVVGFGAGEPDFDTPEHIKQSGIDAIQNNFTRYTPAPGIMELREAICNRLQTDCNVRYEPSQIVCSSGAKHNLYLAFQALLNPGDEVILPAPYWVSYEEMIRMASGVPVIIATDEKTLFKIDAQRLESAITPQTKALVLNSPCNPTGMCYNEAELRALADVCVRHGIYVISDEIYYQLLFDGRTFTSFAALGEEIKAQTILINGVSKSYAMTGWRLGYAAAPKEIAGIMSNYQSHSTSAPCGISQKAAFAALTGPQEHVAQMRRAFETRRDFFVDQIKHIDGVSCLKPEGAFYVMMNIAPLIGSRLFGETIGCADDFAGLLLRRGQVAVVPCDGFGAPHHLRWSYAVSMETIQKGLDRLERFLAEGRSA